MDIITPGIGLVFWTGLLFTIVLLILSKFAFKPIAQALKEREESISNALNASEKAKKDVDSLKGEIDKMKQEARAERESILKEAKDNASKIIADAQDKAKEESNRIVTAAQEAIQAEKKAALTDVKKQVAKISLDIAEKIIRKELADKDAQNELAKNYLKEVNMN